MLPPAMHATKAEIETVSKSKRTPRQSALLTELSDLERFLHSVHAKNATTPAPDVAGVRALTLLEAASGPVIVPPAKRKTTAGGKSSR